MPEIEEFAILNKWFREKFPLFFEVNTHPLYFLRLLRWVDGVQGYGPTHIMQERPVKDWWGDRTRDKKMSLCGVSTEHLYSWRADVSDTMEEGQRLCPKCVGRMNVIGRSGVDPHA